MLISAYVFFLTPALLLLTIILFSYIGVQNSSSFLSFQKSPKVAYAALPVFNSSYVLKMSSKDARVEIIRNFFTKYKSTLAPYSEFIVTTADKYDMDYRLIPAIAMQESTLCKNLPTKLKGTYNCWGFGIYGKKVTKFANYHEAIDTVTKTLAKNYKDKGLVDPIQIMSKYTPSNDGTWAKNVAGLMEGLSI